MANIGIIGLGFMGRMHLAAYGKIDGAKIVAVADKDAKRAAGDLSGGWANVEGAAESIDMSDKFGTTDFRELIEHDSVEMVDICVPTPFHTELAIAALKAGKHVLCEKPLALTSVEAQKIADAAAEASGLFMPAMCMRFWPQWKWLKDAVDDGRFGGIRDAHFQRLGPMPGGWFTKGDMSGGGILDLHIHDTDFVSFLLGKPDAVFSRGYCGTSGRVDHVLTQYIYNDGPPAVSAEGSWAVDKGFGFNMRYRVNFEEATVVFNTASEHKLTVHKGGETEHVDIEGDGYAIELAYFLDCIAKGEAPSVVTADDAVLSVKIIEAEVASVESGRIVEI
ncbi:MAG: gfo/Idh/MocA family oxidoreductase [Phycisphaera sp.]|nr:gfo/Idh/MocA family oxidoreductase [Phycisphaera sp.]